MLVVANETVLGEPLLDRIRERAPRERAGELPDHLPAERSRPGRASRGASAGCGAALTRLRSEGIEAHGQVAHPDPFTAAMHAVRDERVDAILVSTFPEQRGSSWLRRDLVGRLRSETKRARRARRRRAGRGRRSPHERARRGHAHAHHGPPIANQSSRVDATVLGMFLFIASEAMLFGAFFTAYFFVRVVNPDAQPWPLRRFHLPGLRRRREHGDAADVELHDALGAPVDQARQPGRAARPGSC